MAYTSGDHLIQIRGNLPGGEVWANTWCVKEVGGGGPYQDAVDDLHQFYSDIKADLSNGWDAVSATSKNLGTSVTVPAAWTTITGTDTNDDLPTEVAVRLSFDDGQNHNGGPFLAGFTTGALAGGGLYLDGTLQTTIAGTLTNLNNNLSSHNFALALNRTSVGTTATVATAKVGKVFDVIRRRRSDLAEAFVTW